MSPDESNDFLRPPNDGAYETEEVRTGPPLDYVAEKFRRCLEGLHGAIREIQSGSQPDATTGDGGQAESVPYQARYAFHSAIVGYLALHNLLALANQDDLDERLLTHSRDEFSDWLDRIKQAGSLTG